MIQLVKASQLRDFQIAAEVLTSVAVSLEQQGKALWSTKQTSATELMRSYQLNELFFIQKSSQIAGVIFLQTTDPLFWPERTALRDSLYLHKFAIWPEYQGQGTGYIALEAIKNFAIQQAFQTIRLDCDGTRKRLRLFYESFGFQFVDRAEMEGFDVARYVMPLTKESKQ